MEEQRTDASPAPMIPLTIGNDFIWLFIRVLRYLNLARKISAFWVVFTMFVRVNKLQIGLY